MTQAALADAILAWSNRVLATRTLGAFATELGAPPGLPDESLTGRLLLTDPRHELRLLGVGEASAGSFTDSLVFVDALEGLAPALSSLHAPWVGPYCAADHALVENRAGLTHLALLPLPHSSGLTGIYAVGARGAAPALAMAGASWLEHVAGQVYASADRLFQRARLLRAGAVDPMTGWNGLPYMHARLREQVAACERRQEPAACVVIDLDGLAVVNETHGVAAGDAALIEVGARIEALVRASDTFAHLGEDEFALLLPATPEAGAIVVAQRVLDTMRAAPVPCGLLQLPMRVSIGIAPLPTASLVPGYERKAVADQWLAAAHAALHDAKRAGGDGCALSAVAAAAPGISARPPAP